MSDVIKYKGYMAHVQVSIEDRVMYGKIEGINDLITFEAESLDEIKNEFESAVDDYLEFCQDVGKSPEKTYNGTFNVRIKPELHRSLARLACEKRSSLNKVVEVAIENYLSPDRKERCCEKNGIACDAYVVNRPFEFESFNIASMNESGVNLRRIK
ncbi:Predicted nuclease of the RNAse H fold, HicB family [Eubacterium aggregans]|uniref:Predicted nuclease of the RNAse H fold, HicB family n=1 Tax=Eubacterium aggregans TaxID=81409 RepID=A0A1H3Y431_9FIRM|nr:type II toxin-antitoxin system HicB family antitoxin [Eubacterium aggregans]SEA06376.1 Predicted nuclease of the RNAse H fold, HicB family [Eubacterium aggregans]